MHLLFKSILKYTWAIILLALSWKTNAQIQFPVQATLVVAPPYSPFVSDYFDPTGIKLNATLVYRDFSGGARDVGLRIRIEADNGFEMVTKPNYKSISPISLTPGVPYQLSGGDWSEYFNFSNLNISGVNTNEFVSNGVFPEGFYTFYLEVLDHRSNRVISNEAFATALIRLGGVPIVIAPNSNFVVPREPQNIVFQWMMSAPPVDPATTEYQLQVYEITTEGVAPEVALTSGNALEVFKSDFQPATVFQYDASATSLELGKRYLYYVQVQDENGNFLFTNNGLSEPYWFEYGYPTGGSIALKAPESNYQFTKEDQRIFSWEVPDNKAEPAQPVVYHFKVVELTAADQDPVAAIANNEVFFEEESAETSSLTPWDTEVDKEFEKGAFYAWQVKANSGEQEVAQSEIRIFQGPPLITEFKAGQHLVTVLELENNDLNSLKGKGRIKLDKDGEKTVDLSFDSLKIVRQGNLDILDKGVLEGDISILDPIAIKALEEGEGDIVFTPNGVRLDNTRLQLRGTFEIPFNLPIDGDSPNIITDNVYANYNNFVVTGGVPISATFKLLDPLYFTIVLDTNTVVNIGNEGYRIAFYGNILPPNVFDSNGDPLNVPFINRKEIDYIEIDSERDDLVLQSFSPIPNSEFKVQPKKYTIDFDDTRSSSGKPKEWKGIMVDEYEVVFGEKLDKGGKFSASAETIQFNASETAVINELTSTGLKFEFDQDLAGLVTGAFNGFSAKFNKLKLIVDESLVKEGKLDGGFVIPVINSSKQFKFSSTITDAGFQQGVLEDDLRKEKIYFGKENPSTQINFDIVRVDLQPGFIDFTVDIFVNELNYTFKNCKNFRAFGKDYQIGFETPNGSVAFDRTITINYKGGIELSCDRVNAMSLNGKYYCGIGAYFAISEDIRGEDGPLGIEMFAQKAVGEEITVPTDYTNEPVFSPSSAQLNADPKEVELFDSTVAILDCKVANLQGKIGIRENVPEWGTVFSGELSGYVYSPSKIEAGGKLISGKLENGLKYWIANVYAMDDGVGVAVVPGYVNMVALEGMFFRHMAPTLSDNGRKIELKPSRNVEYGAGLYTQLIDATSFGRKVKADLGLEMIYERNEYNLTLQGEATIFNLEGRTPVGEAGDVVVEEVIKEVAKRVGTQCIDESGYNLCMTIDPDLKGGKLSGSKSGRSIAVGGRIDPKMGSFLYDDSEWNVEVTGGSGAMAFDLEKKKGNAFTLGMGYLPADSAYIDFDYSPENLTIGGAFNFDEQAANMRFGYGFVFVSAYANKSDKAGSIFVKPNEDFRINGNFDATNKAAGLGIQFNDDEYALEAAQRGYGKLTIKNGSKTLLTQFDRDSKEALFTYEESGDFTVDAYASPDTGRFNFNKVNEYKYAASFNKAANSGGMKLIFSEENQYSFRINVAENSGFLNVTNPNGNFQLGASQEASSGYFNMELPSGELLQSNANLQEKTGLFDLTFSEGYYIASLHTDSARFLAEPTADNFTFETSVHAEGRGLAHYAKEGDFVKLKGDKIGYGFLDYNMENIAITTEISKPLELAKMRLDLGADTLNMSMDKANQNAYLNAFFSGIYVGAYVNQGTRGGVVYDDQTRQIELGAGNSFGRAKYAEAGNLFFVESDKDINRQIGRGIYEGDSIYALRDISSGQFIVRGKFDNYLAGVGFDGDQGGDAYFKDGSRSIEATANAAAYGSLTYEEQSILGYVSKDENSLGNFRLLLNEDSVNAYINPNDKAAHVKTKFQNYTVHAAAAEVGDAMFYFNDETHRTTANISEGKVMSTTYANPQDSLGMFGDFNNGTGNFYSRFNQVVEYGAILSSSSINAGFIIDGHQGDVLIDTVGFNSVTYAGPDYELEVSGEEFTAPKLYFKRLNDFIDLQREDDGSISLAGEYQGTGYGASVKATQQNELSFTWNGLKVVGYHTDANNGKLTLASNNIELTTLNGDTTLLSYSGEVEVLVNAAKLLVKKGTEELELDFSANPSLRINGIDQSYNGSSAAADIGGISIQVRGKSVELQADSETLKAGILATNSPAINYPFANESAIASINGKESTIQYGAQSVSYKTDDQIELRFSPLAAVSVKRDALLAQIENAIGEVVDLQTMSITYNQYKAEALPGEWKISRNDTSLTLKVEKEAIAEIGTDIKVTANTQRVEGIYKNYVGEVTTNKTARFEDGTRKVNVSEHAVSYEEGEIFGRADKQLVEAEFKYESDKKGLANLDKIEVQYENYRGKVGADSSIMFTDGTYLGDLADQELLVKELPVGRFAKLSMKDKFVEVNDAQKHEVKITEKDLIGKWEDYEFGAGIDTMLYVKNGDKYFRVRGQNLLMKYDDVEVEYLEQKVLKAKYAENNFLASLPDLLLKGNYQNYEAGVGFEEGVWYKDGVREGLVDWEKVYAKYDDRQGTAFYVAQELELIDGDRREFSGSMSHIAYTEKEQEEGDYRFKLSQDSGLIYDDPWNMFKFNNDLDVIIKKLPNDEANQYAGDIQLGVKNLIQGEKEFFISRGAGDTEGGSQGIAFTKDEGFKATWDYQGQQNFVAIAGDKSHFGFKLFDNEIYAKQDYLFAKRQDYGLVYGGPYLGNVFYQNDTVKVAEVPSGYELEFRDGDKGVAINTIGEITVMNKNQRVIAGGEEPMRFEDPDNGVQETNNKAAPFSFNIAGIVDFAVEPIENNDVKIWASTEAGNFGLQSYGQGRLTCEVFTPGTLGDYGGKKLGTLYKNQYSWGLALGDEDPEVAGPQAEGATVELGGPQNIGKITENSNSLIQVKAVASYSSKTETLILNGEAIGTKPMLCFDNLTIDSEFSPDGWYVLLGKREQSKWASFRPLCMSLQSKGYFYADHNLNYEMGAGVSISTEVSTGYFTVVPNPVTGPPVLEAKLGAYFRGGISGVGKFSMNPFSVRAIEVEAYAKAGLEACGKAVGNSLGCKTLIGVSIEGRLMLNFETEEKDNLIIVKSTKVEGEVEACIEVFGEEFCGDMDIKMSL